MLEKASLTILDQWTLFVCRLGIAGRSPIMPGTCGTLMAAVLAPFVFLPLSLGARVLVLGVVFWVGSIAATRAELLLQCKDPGEVVIDELLGYWLVLLPFAAPGWKVMLVALVLFRFFDMVKPWPVRQSEEWLPGGYGVMIDDVVAGVQALLILGLLRWLGWV